MNSDVVLGIGQTHNSSAALLVDGRLVAAASEERFNRQKNTTAFPLAAVQYVLSATSVSPNELSAVVHSYRHPVPGFALEREKASRALERGLGQARGLANRVITRIPASEVLFRGAYQVAAARMQSRYEQRFRSQIADVLGIDQSKVILADHHLCHAFAGYAFYLTGNNWERPVLIFTLDAEGDDKSATVCVGRAGQIDVLSVTPGGRSVGVLYGAVTEWLGMQMNEHEYKVMGLAPYAPAEMSRRAQEVLEQLAWVEGLEFRTAVSSGAFPHVLRRRLDGHRFDAVAGGIQALLESLVEQWVKRAIEQTGIQDVVLSGGVFMNVKANLAVAEMPEVSTVTVCPSAADESTPIGAAMSVCCQRLRGQGARKSQSVRVVDDLFLGPSFSDREISDAINRAGLGEGFEIARMEHAAIPEQVAILLGSGKVVARFAGRMEFGARALGNRSILADPSNRAVVRIINEQIKGRDFWMPFACTILAERADEYIDNPKQIAGPYMAIAFRSKPELRDTIIAGLHPYDYTARPQILKYEDNPEYHQVIAAFERKTGIGGLLNTSFNLHGEPVVCSPEDALDVFLRSGLEILQLEDWIINKVAP